VITANIVNIASFEKRQNNNYDNINYMDKTQPITFVIFGGTGDLAKNKIFPALLDLKIKKLLPQKYKIVGFSRKDLSDSDYRDFVANADQSLG
jgi:glucose-6-phosphate 1-dehydrogenase